MTVSNPWVTVTAPQAAIPPAMKALDVVLGSAVKAAVLDVPKSGRHDLRIMSGFGD